MIATLTKPYPSTSCYSLPSAARGRVREGAEASPPSASSLQPSGDSLQPSIATLEPGAWSLTPPHASTVRVRAAGFPDAMSHSTPPASGLRPPASPRRGISLLEVLVAVFVLTLGLMGIAMVIPAGQVLMADAARADRATACGRAALNDVQVRRWHNPGLWWQKWWPSTGVTATRPALVNGGLLYGETYFLDPRFFVYGSNTSKDSIRNFPYSAHPEREFALYGSAPRFWPNRARARRVGFSITEPLADRLTTWADELIFSLGEDGGRPRQMYTWLDVASPTNPSEDSAFPVLPSDEFDITGKLPQHSSDQGRLTWSVMITPIVPLAYRYYDLDGDPLTPKEPRIDWDLIGLWDHDGGAGTLPVPLVPPARITRYEISIVVFYKRDFYCPEGSSDPTTDELRLNPDLEVVRERSVYAQLFGGGIGGGDVLLFVPDGDASRPPGYLDVKKDDWIMLKGLDRAGYVGPPNRACIPTCPTVCKWYRVVGVDDLETGMPFPNPEDTSNPLTGRQRYVTLAGPDWEVDTTAPAGFSGATDIAEAALIDDVVGVYTTILDTNEL